MLVGRIFNWLMISMYMSKQEISFSSFKEFGKHLGIPEHPKESKIGKRQRDAQKPIFGKEYTKVTDSPQEDVLTHQETVPIGATSVERSTEQEQKNLKQYFQKQMEILLQECGSVQGITDRLMGTIRDRRLEYVILAFLQSIQLMDKFPDPQVIISQAKRVCEYVHTKMLEDENFETGQGSADALLEFFDRYMLRLNYIAENPDDPDEFFSFKDEWGEVSVPHERHEQTITPAEQNRLEQHFEYQARMLLQECGTMEAVAKKMMRGIEDEELKRHIVSFLEDLWKKDKHQFFDTDDIEARVAVICDHVYYGGLGNDSYDPDGYGVETVLEFFERYSTVANLKMIAKQPVFVFKFSDWDQTLAKEISEKDAGRDAGAGLPPFSRGEPTAQHNVKSQETVLEASFIQSAQALKQKIEQALQGFQKGLEYAESKGNMTDVSIRRLLIKAFEKASNEFSLIIKHGRIRMVIKRPFREDYRDMFTLNEDKVSLESMEFYTLVEKIEGYESLVRHWRNELITKINEAKRSVHRNQSEIDVSEQYREILAGIVNGLIKIRMEAEEKAQE